MAEAIYLCEKENPNSPIIEGVRAILLNSDDAALVDASAVLTFSGTGTDGDTVTIDGVVYTLKDTPAAANDVQIGGDADGTGENLAAAIDLSGTEGTEYFAGTEAVATVTAANSSGAVTLTAVDQGPAGNGIRASTDSDDADFTVTKLVGGDVDTAGSAVITLDDAGTDGEIIKIGSVTYTLVDAVAGSDNANEVHIGATAADTATNLKNAINASGGTPGTDYGDDTVAHPNVTAESTSAAVTVTNRETGSDTDGFDEEGNYSPVAPVQVSGDGDVTITSPTNGELTGGTYGDLGAEAAAACNRAFDVELFRNNYFDKFTEIDDLSSGPLADDQSALVISSFNGVISVDPPA